MCRWVLDKEADHADTAAAGVEPPAGEEVSGEGQKYPLGVPPLPQGVQDQLDEALPRAGTQVREAGHIRQDTGGGLGGHTRCTTHRCC